MEICSQRFGLSVSADGFPLGAHTVSVASDHLDEITGVNVSLSDRVDNVLGSVLNFLLALRQHLDLEVVTNKLVVENGSTKLTA